jgi:intracellular multiplication protein IcmG
MQQPSSEETPVLTQEAPKAVPKGDGFLNNPEKLSEVEQLHDTMEFEETTVNADGAEPPMPAPVQSGDAPIPRSPLTPMPSGETPPPLENAQAMPVIQNNSAETFPALLPKAQDIALDTSGSSAQTENPTSDKMTAELSQMNEMLSSLADRMGDLEDKVGVLADSSGGAPTADLKEIKVALSKLEKRVNAIAEDSSSASHAFAPAASKAAPLKTAAQVPATKEWILKAAQPGRAIVTRAGSDETYAVSVGENLDGIGKISSVSQQDGKWVVQGASGKIVQ